MNWKPFSVEEVKSIFGNYDRWFLAGGESLDLYFGKKTRDHSDIDIGVFSIHAEKLISILENHGLKVFSATKGKLVEYKNSDISNGLYNFWISDTKHFKLQLIVYPVKSSKVIFRRNNKIKWDMKTFTIDVKGIRILNPLVSYAFKLTTKNIEEKDLKDVQELTDFFGRNY